MVFKAICSVFPYQGNKRWCENLISHHLFKQFYCHATLNEAILFTILIMERRLIERTIIKSKDTLSVFTWFCAS